MNSKALVVLLSIMLAGCNKAHNQILPYQNPVEGNYTQDKLIAQSGSFKQYSIPIIVGTVVGATMFGGLCVIKHLIRKNMPAHHEEENLNGEEDFGFEDPIGENAYNEEESEYSLHWEMG
jgi:hypothetical protein